MDTVTDLPKSPTGNNRKDGCSFCAGQKKKCKTTANLPNMKDVYKNYRRSSEELQIHRSTTDSTVQDSHTQ